MTFIEIEHIPSWFKVVFWRSLLMYVSVPVVDLLCGLEIAAILKCAVVSGPGYYNNCMLCFVMFTNKVLSYARRVSLQRR